MWGRSDGHLPVPITSRALHNLYNLNKRAMVRPRWRGLSPNTPTSGGVGGLVVVAAVVVVIVVVITMIIIVQSSNSSLVVRVAVAVLIVVILVALKLEYDS